MLDFKKNVVKFWSHITIAGYCDYCTYGLRCPAGHNEEWDCDYMGNQMGFKSTQSGLVHTGDIMT